MSVQKVILLVGIILILLSSFGVQFGPADLFRVGVGIAFASFLL